MNSGETQVIIIDNRLLFFNGVKQYKVAEDCKFEREQFRKCSKASRQFLTEISTTLDAEIHLLAR